MFKDRKVAVVVPAYNEELLISKVITTMPDFVDKIIIVDDCSSDNTSKEVNQLKGDFESLVLIRHETNQGVGGAIATGYKWARDHDWCWRLAMDWLT